ANVESFGCLSASILSKRQTRSSKTSRTTSKQIGPTMRMKNDRRQQAERGGYGRGHSRPFPAWRPSEALSGRGRGESNRRARQPRGRAETGGGSSRFGAGQRPYRRGAGLV